MDCGAGDRAKLEGGNHRSPSARSGRARVNVVFPRVAAHFVDGRRTGAVRAGFVVAGRVVGERPELERHRRARAHAKRGVDVACDVVQVSAACRTVCGHAREGFVAARSGRVGDAAGDVVLVRVRRRAGERGQTAAAQRRGGARVEAAVVDAVGVRLRERGAERRAGVRPERVVAVTGEEQQRGRIAELIEGEGAAARAGAVRVAGERGSDRDGLQIARRDRRERYSRRRSAGTTARRRRTRAPLPRLRPRSEMRVPSTSENGRTPASSIGRAYGEAARSAALGASCRRAPKRRTTVSTATPGWWKTSAVRQ